MSDKDLIRQRTLEAAHLQAIEGNPFDQQDYAMFEMFERKGFSPEQRRAYIFEQSKRRLEQQEDVSVNQLSRR